MATPPARDARKGLGRGLSALLGDERAPAAGEETRGAREVPIEFLRPGRFQPRQRFDDEAIGSLVASIRQHGVLQPILVRRVAGEGEAYEIVAGERRWRAAQRAQLARVPVVVKRLDDSQSLEVALVENIQRENLSPIEEAEGYRRLIDEFGHSQEELAGLVARSRSHVANMLRLLRLPQAVRDMLDDGRLSAGHARALLAVDDPLALAARIVREGLNVRAVEAIARAGGDPAPRRRRAPAAKDADTVALERELSEALGLKVEIAHRGERGSVQIGYRSLEQLDEICRRLRSVS